MTGFVGRQSEQAKLRRAIEAAVQGKGRLLLLAGEAGVGKTRLADETLAQSDLLTLTGPAIESVNLAYAPLVAVLRAYLRLHPAGLDNTGPLSQYLAALLPELGPKPAESDQPTLFEAIAAALRTIAQARPTAIVLDDLQWADNATLDFLPVVAAMLNDVPLLITGIYRSDEIPRGHALRRVRAELRRLRLLHEIVLPPLKPADTATLAGHILKQPVAPTLAATLYDRTQGIPLFIEELVIALNELGRLQAGENGLELTPETDLPVPQSIRDAILLRLDKISTQGRQFLEVAAVAGMQVNLDMVSSLVGSDTGLEAAISHGFLSETRPGQAEFRHALTREAIYKEVIWTRRRVIHRQIAQRLEADGAPPQLVAEHWLQARDVDKARQALIVATQQACALHAYRDAAATAERALEIWPENSNEAERLEMLDRLGYCAQLSGQLSDAALAWRELAQGHQAAGNQLEFAQTQRRLAGVYQMQGAWSQAVAARQTAASTYVACNLPAEAAAEYLAMAAHIQGTGQYSSALKILELAEREAEAGHRPDLLARTLGVKGLVLGKLGRVEEGLKTARQGLALALEHNLTGPASEIYWRYASTLEQAADYKQARAAYLSAIDYCHTHGASTMEQLCLACAAGVFWHTGEWQEAISLCRQVLAVPNASTSIRSIASGYFGSILAFRGQAKRARKLLAEATMQARQNEVLALELICVWGLAMCDELDFVFESAVGHCRYILETWTASEERHYVIPALRWAATFLSGRQAHADVQACAKALADIAAATGNQEALAGLAHALGEAALLNNEPQQAAKQFERSLELLGAMESPIQTAETQFRAGVAQIAAGERERGIQHLVSAHRTARKLTARVLAQRIAEQLDSLGEPLHERLGRRAAGRTKRGGLTRRQLEVMRHIALGKTNQEIAETLVLSVRTVDMHVSNILIKLDCRTRAEAVRKAGELGLLD